VVFLSFTLYQCLVLDFIQYYQPKIKVCAWGLLMFQFHRKVQGAEVIHWVKNHSIQLHNKLISEIINDIGNKH
jgi:hypothetical protein